MRFDLHIIHNVLGDQGLIGRATCIEDISVMCEKALRFLRDIEFDDPDNNQYRIEMRPSMSDNDEPLKSRWYGEGHPFLDFNGYWIEEIDDYCKDGDE